MFTTNLLILLALKTLWIGSSSAKRGSSKRKNKASSDNRQCFRQRLMRVNRRRTTLCSTKTLRTSMMKVANRWRSSCRIIRSSPKVQPMRLKKRITFQWKIIMSSPTANLKDQWAQLLRSSPYLVRKSCKSQRISKPRWEIKLLKKLLHSKARVRSTSSRIVLSPWPSTLRLK